MIILNANQNLNQNATIGCFTQVVLSPDEFYLQSTNFDLTDYNKIVLVDVCENEVLDITSKVFINGFDFEIIKIKQDFYFDDLFIKFINTSNNYFLLSNPIKVTNEILSTRFDYKNLGTVKMQSIRLGCYFNTLKNEISGSEYVNEIGYKLSSVSIITDLESYIFEKLDNLSFRSLVQILNKPIKYINSKRVTNSVLPKEIEIIGTTNVGNSDFVVGVNYNDTFAPTLQIADPLTILDFYPNSYYTILSFQNKIQITFNHPISLISGGSITIVGYATYIENEIIIIGNVLNINIDPFIGFNGVYTIQISENFITSDFGTLPSTEWEFTIQDADFNATDFNSTDFFTN